MTSLVPKGRTGVLTPWLEKVRIWSHKAVHVVSAHKLLSPGFYGGNWLNVTTLLWSALQQITIITMLFMIKAICLTINIIITLKVFNFAQTSSWSASERLVNKAVSRRAKSSPNENNSLVVTACPQWERGAVVSSWWEKRELVEVSRGGF